MNSKELYALVEKARTCPIAQMQLDKYWDEEDKKNIVESHITKETRKYGSKEKS